MKINFKLIVWIVLFQAISFFISLSMRGPVDNWYLSLIKSPLTPPGYVFGIVWPILYLLLAIVGWRFWKLEDTDEVIRAKKVFIFQMVINWAWSPVYFLMNMMDLALCIIAAMILLTIYVIGFLLHKDKVAGLLLVPYFIWISFAFYLNYFTWVNN